MKTRNELKVEHIIQTAQDKMKSQNNAHFKGQIMVGFKGELVILKQRTNSRERRPSISELDQRLS